MPESLTHATLVQSLVTFAQSAIGPLAEIAVREDSVRPIRGERPPRIGGYTPDVLATDVPTTMTMIGEAKTRLDLEREHSRLQIAAFLRHLAVTRGGIFVLAVPLAASATARRLLGDLASPFGSGRPRLVILDGNKPYEF